LKTLLQVNREELSWVIRSVNMCVVVSTSICSFLCYME